MRTLLKVTADIKAANQAVTDGTLPAVLDQTIRRLKPEATYFYTEGGQRSFFLVFDMKDASEIPVIAEPLFLHLNAHVEFHPVMNQDELQKGLKTALKTHMETVV